MFLTDLSFLFCVSLCEYSGLKFPCIVLVVGETDEDKNPGYMTLLPGVPVSQWRVTPLKKDRKRKGLAELEIRTCCRS